MLVPSKSEDGLRVNIDLRTIEEACEKLKIGRPHFFRLVQYKDIRVVSFLGARWITQGELDRVIEVWRKKQRDNMRKRRLGYSKGFIK